MHKDIRAKLLEELNQLCVDETAACRAEKKRAAELYQRLYPDASKLEVAKASGLGTTTVARMRSATLNPQSIPNGTSEGVNDEPGKQCKVVQFGEPHATPERVQSIIDQLAQIKEPAEKSLICIWIELNWQLYPKRVEA